MGWYWILIDIVAPLMLLAALIWVYFRNRRPRPGEIARAERGARELREDLEEDEARRGAP